MTKAKDKEVKVVDTTVEDMVQSIVERLRDVYTVAEAHETDGGQVVTSENSEGKAITIIVKVAK